MSPLQTTTSRVAAPLALLLALVLVVVTATSAAADTSSSSAQAAAVTVAGTGVVTSPQSASVNDGSQTAQTDSGGGNASALLPGQQLITGGTLVQRTRALPDGTSAACAGIVGAGGSVSIGADGGCTTSAGSGGLRIDLLGLATVTASAITASCTSSADGTTSARSTLAGARVTALIIPIDLAASAAPNTGVSVPGVADLLLNKQAGSGSQTSVTALKISLLGAVADVSVGSVTCGPNARVVPTTAVPRAGILWMVVAVIGILTAVVVRRRPAARERLGRGVHLQR